MSEPWDVRRAVALAALFRLLQGAARGCSAPFLPLYLRLLGLPAPLVGAVAGAGQLAALAVPLCCPRGRAGRLLLAGSVLGSAAASLALTLIPPAGGTGDTGCPHSLQLGRPSLLPPPLLLTVPTAVPSPVTTPAPGPGTRGYRAPNPGALTHTRAVPRGTGVTAADVLAASRKPSTGSTTSQGLSGSTGALQEHGRGESLNTTENAHVSENLSDSRDVTFEAVQSISQDRQYWVFLLVLGAVVLWELLAASLEWSMDESVYEYLDFVDAADRHGRLWLWGSAGAAAGASGVSVLVDRLDCSLGGSVPRLALHFYGYAVLVMLFLMVGVFFPGRVPRRSGRAPGLAKGLSALRGDGRALLSAGTVFLLGAASSAANNFLPWRLQDQGGSELLLGLWVALGPLAELALPPFRGRLQRALPGGGAEVLSLGALAAQLLSYSLLRAPWAALPVQALSVLSSGALRWRLEGTAGDAAGPGAERSVPALLRGLCAGGAALGSFGGGFVVQSFGLPLLLQASCVGLGLWTVCFVIVRSKLPRQREIDYSQLLAADSSEMSDSEEENEKDWLVKAMKDETFDRNWIQQHGIN
uniref:Major facilitator superfamily domain containing 6 like n=1 Tax=Cyanoderma ruficeps TaxID=181631 RepID=A0A8C3NTD4_9PASS